MDLTSFLRDRRPGWRELEQLLERVEGSGLASLSEEQAVQLGILYRRTASDLNQAQTFVSGETTVRYLNDLVARAYLSIYGRKKLDLLGGLVSLMADYPAIFRRAMGFFLVSTLIFSLGAVFGYLTSHYDPLAARAYLFPTEMTVIEPQAEGEDDATPKMSSNELAAFSSFLFTHNLTVTLVVFAMGITLGIGTVWLLFANGLLLGVIGAIFVEAGQLKSFATGVLPHGVLEIPACLIGGAAGLMLAQGIWQARPWSRREELGRRGKEALLLVAGCVPLLGAAAILEAGVARAPDWVIGSGLKLTVAGVVGLLFVAYVTLGGWRREA